MFGCETVAKLIFYHHFTGKMRDYFSLHHHDLWLAETFPANFSNQSVRAWPAHRRLKQRGWETSTRNLYLHCPCASLAWHWLRLITLSCVWFVGFSVFWRYKITTSLKYQIIVKKDVSYQTFSGYCEQKCFKTNKSLTFVWLIPHYLVLGYINLGCD